ncbi:SIS domain-containing protein [Sphingomonas sp. J344]|uniref:SIS domain-containing protein n=1 Tax=Sphingomonas sp. J344 TaxID=2898434 RepID=UPI0021518A02|nr:SIS domain-containing protein [Sphingomonas sp. J344]MCR5871189.1 SIS domain-containing protein [Sphingomonas sp. J344]
MAGAAAMADRTTLMESEAGEAADAVARMLDANRATFARIAARLVAHPPETVITCARGSSDHAATYAKYLIETRTGVPVVSAALSVATLFDAPVVPGNRLVIAISQSGRSPDLLATVALHRRAGAFVVALVNAEDAPLRDLADEVIALSAGPERSVAATKSYIASLAAVAALTGAWAKDATIANGVAQLPDLLRAAWALDWSAGVSALAGADNLFVLGRGHGYGIAQEAALKFKETCALHAESFSAAEVRHGPMAIVGRDFHVLAFGGSDRAGASVRETATEFRARGAKLLLADPVAADAELPALAAHPAIEPILMVQSFYALANAVALARGLNPDAPPHLRKVTETL